MVKITVPNAWILYLEQSILEPVGIALICKCPEGADQAKRQLYLARAKAREDGNTSLDSLSISMSPHSDDILFIYKSEVEDAESIGPATEAGDAETV